MAAEKSPAEIAKTILSAFPEADAKAAPDKLEAVLRPLGFISWQMGQAVQEILSGKDRLWLGMDVINWVEANVVTGPPDAERERSIRFLQEDTCTCVLAHLKSAIQHGHKPIDPRVKQLLKHDYFH